MEKLTFELDGISYERTGRYDPPSGRIFVEHAFTRGATAERHVMSQRIFTYRELAEMLSSAGFVDLRPSAGLNDEPFGLGGKRFLLTATKG